MNLTEIERRLRVCWDKRAGELEAVMAERDRLRGEVESLQERVRLLIQEKGEGRS